MAADKVESGKSVRVGFMQRKEVGERRQTVTGLEVQESVDERVSAVQRLSISHHDKYAARMWCQRSQIC